MFHINCLPYRWSWRSRRTSSGTRRTATARRSSTRSGTSGRARASSPSASCSTRWALRSVPCVPGLLFISTRLTIYKRLPFVKETGSPMQNCMLRVLFNFRYARTARMSTQCSRGWRSGCPRPSTTPTPSWPTPSSSSGAPSAGDTGFTVWDDLEFWKYYNCQKI